MIPCCLIMCHVDYNTRYLVSNTAVWIRQRHTRYLVGVVTRPPGCFRSLWASSRRAKAPHRKRFIFGVPKVSRKLGSFNVSRLKLKGCNPNLHSYSFETLTVQLDYEGHICTRIIVDDRTAHLNEKAAVQSTLSYFARRTPYLVGVAFILPILVALSRAASDTNRQASGKGRRS